jgi:Carboxypeptidase regulatory-like domain
MRKISMRAISVSFAFLALAAVSMAQTTDATIVGTIVDPQGGTVPNATITVKNTGTGVAREVQSSEAGLYRVYPLNPGTYEVTVTAPGFKTELQQNVVLDAAANVKVDFKLEVGGVSETVEVAGAAPILQTQDASVGGTVTSSEVSRLPVNGRNYTRLILLMPGTSDQGCAT